MGFVNYLCFFAIPQGCDCNSHLVNCCYLLSYTCVYQTEKSLEWVKVIMTIRLIAFRKVFSRLMANYFLSFLFIFFFSYFFRIFFNKAFKIQVNQEHNQTFQKYFCDFLLRWNISFAKHKTLLFLSSILLQWLQFCLEDLIILLTPKCGYDR